ncbi:hypothetical protein K501DRAFT_287974 [Backusella circina FSU 941]|nr:hypothetical protein K501DRAFT_287974 [Backusella circina FSU 941]
MTTRPVVDQWLSLPSEIENDSFSTDLLRQFDKRRSKLHFELGLLEQEPSPDSSSVLNTPSLHEEPVRLDDIDDEELNSVASVRRRSAGDLLRRSSAFFKSKFNQFKANRSHDNLSQPPTRVIMKTTISLGNTLPYGNNSTPPSSIPPIRPPTITQYPPKPLVYSPVEPLPEEPKQKTLLHRISMPLMRKAVYNASLDSRSSKQQRRQSESDKVKRKQKQKQSHTL